VKKKVERKKRRKNVVLTKIYAEQGSQKETNGG
jgi:hypothetical protein